MLHLFEIIENVIGGVGLHKGRQGTLNRDLATAVPKADGDKSHQRTPKMS